MKALIDGDIILYKAGFSVEKTIYDITVHGEDKPRVSCASAKDRDAWLESNSDLMCFVTKHKEVEEERHALQNAKTLIEHILEQCDTKDFDIILSGARSFRHSLFSEYKANRRDSSKPIHYEAISSCLKDNYSARAVDGIEGDDELGIQQTILGDKSIICTIDKDLDMIPGWHFNWDKDLTYEISEDTALRNFYRQLLTGDRTDNIKGLEGVGMVSASRLIKDDEPNGSLYEIVKKQYISRGMTEEQLYLNAQLLWILREPLPEGMWKPPQH